MMVGFRLKTLVLSSVTALTVTCSLVAGAQVSTTDQLKILPGALTPDMNNPYTNKPNEIKPADAVPQSAKEAPEAIDIDDELPEAPTLDPSLTRPIHINEIQVEGVSRLSDKEIQEITSPFIGKDVPFTELQDAIADKLTDLYEEKGYITTLVFIPPQKIENGIIKIKADEGVINEVRFEGFKYVYPRLALRPRFDLKAGDVFQVQDLQRSMRRINENTDMNVQATLKAGPQSGQTDVVISPKKQSFFIHFAPFFDNLGREPIGLYRGGATLSSSNALGLGDSAYSSYFFTKKSWGLINGYELPIGSHGTKVGMSYATSRFRFSQAGNQYKGHSNFYLPYVTQELYRSERVIIGTELTLGIKESQFFANGVRNSSDQEFVVNPALNGRFFDSTGQTFIRSELSMGSVLTDADNTSRTNAGRAFIKSTTSVSRVQKLPWQTYGIFKAMGQFTPDSLLSLEQFQLGGNATVRGYKEGRLIGDQGFLVSSEWRIPWNFIPDSLQIHGYHPRRNLEFVTFADYGGVFDNHAFSGVNPLSGKVTRNAFGLGVGVGIRARVTRLLNARLDVAFPCLQLQPDRGDARIHFGLESRLF